jgi:hypothetical protein
MRLPSYSRPFGVLLAVVVAYAALTLLGEWTSFAWGRWDYLFTFSRNDIEYAPSIRSLFAFSGEPALWEQSKQTAGPAVFPYLSLLPYSIFYKLFGAFGFALLEVILIAARFGLLFLFLRCFVASPLVAAVNAFFFETFLSWWVVGRVNELVGVLNRILSAVSGLALPLLPRDQFRPDFYNRVPRPVLTFPLSLIVLWLLARLWTRRRFSRWEAIGLGLGYAMLVSSNLHLFIGLGLVGLLIFVLVCADSQAEIAGRGRGLLAWASAALVGGSIPWVLQTVVFGNKEVQARLGVVSIPYGKIFVEPLAGRFFAIFLLLLVVIRWVSGWRSPPAWVKKLDETRLLSFGTIFMLGALLAMPVLPVFTGKTCFEGNFYKLMYDAIVLTCLTLAAVLSERAWSALRSRPWLAGRRAAVLGAVLLTGVASAAWASAKIRTRPTAGHPRADLPYYTLPDSYRSDFIQVTQFLETRPDYEVVLAFDVVFLSYELGFRGKHAYCPPVGFSKASDAEAEDRALRMLRLFGVKDAQLADEVNDFHVQNYFFGGSKYAVTREFSYASLDEYPPEVLKGLHQYIPFPWDDGFFVPKTRMSEIRAQYAALPADAWKKYRLDAIVVLNNDAEKRFVPNPAYFEEVLSNASFRVYYRKSS